MTRRSWVVIVAVALMLGFSSPSPASAVDPTPINQTAPVVTGVARLDATLMASPGTWLPDSASTTYGYAWLRDGAPIAGANQAAYTATNSDLGHRLAVRVVATLGTSASAPATSAETEAVAPGTFTLVSAPAIGGVRRWGRTLTASSGSWSPVPTSISYQWLRDGVPIKGAATRRLALGVGDYGSRISIRAVARRTHYLSSTALSPATAAIGHRVPVRKSFTYSIATRGQVTADLATFAELAAQTYADPRGWRAAGYAFRQVQSGGSFTLVLANASTMASFGEPCDHTWSCRVGRYVVINQTRWLHASPAWNAAHLPLRDYRNMVVDHETGHWLGHHHLSCPGPGRLAPVMMQQSKGLHGCRFNPFPLPSERWTSR